MSTFQPPPTYDEPVKIDQNKKPGQPGYSKFSPIWLKWFVDFAAFITNVTNNGVNVAKWLGGGNTNYLPIQAAVGVTGFLPPSNGWLNYNGTSITWSQAGSFTTMQVTSVGGYKSSDGSTGFTGTVTTASLVGKTITIKDGIITGFA